MSIVEMTRVSIVGAVEDRDRVLHAIADAGVLHVNERREPPRPPERLVERRARILRVLEALEPATRAVDEAARRVDDDELRALEQRLERRERAREQQEQLEQERERGRPWDGLGPEILRELSRRGVAVRVFEVDGVDPDDVELEGAVWTRIVEGPDGQRWLQAVLLAGVEPPWPERARPERSRDRIEAARRELRAELGAAERSWAEAGARHAALARTLEQVDDELAFHRVRDGLEPEAGLFRVEGHCPAARAEGLRAALAGCPVVWRARPPGRDEDVPVALRNGPIARTFEPLVAAFKLPTYGELDPTPLLAPFMGLSFGLCLGDLGYGVVLTGVAGGLLLRRRLPEPVRAGLRWAVVLGSCAMVTGALLGNLFGMRVPALLGVEPSALLFSLVEDPRRLLGLSLGLGVVQLTFGLALRLWRDVRRRRGQAAIGSLAWLLVIPTLGLATVGSGPWWPAAVVGVMLLGFAAPSERGWRRVGGGAWALYEVSGLLSNVASYARIFGLGLSSGIIAMVVNTIAAALAHGPLGTAAAVIVLVVGHAFNFAMAVVGSVVHPARLQLLEFFNTFFTGGGRAYAPYRRNLQGE